MQSPFVAFASHTEAAPSENNEGLQYTAPASARERWQSAGSKLAEKGSLRFDDAAASPSDDTAYRSPVTKPTGIERKSSLTARSSLNLSRFSRSFSDNRVGNTAMAETVRLAQQQQQTNRQSAAPVLKAVPSTKVGVALLSSKHDEQSNQLLDCMPRVSTGICSCITPSLAWVKRIYIGNCTLMQW